MKYYNFHKQTRINKEMFNAAFAYLDDLVYNHTIEQQNQKEN